MKFLTAVSEREVSHALFLTKAMNPTVLNKTVVTVLIL